MALVPSVAAEPIDLDASASEKADVHHSDQEDDMASSDGLSDPGPCDSPPHRREKLQKLWEEELAAVNAFVEDLVEQPSSSSCAAAPPGETLQQWIDEEIQAVNAFTDDLLQESEDVIESDWSSGDNAPQGNAVAAPPTLRPCKYGRCPRHKCVLYPHLRRHKTSQMWGTILLRCSQFKDRGLHKRPGCWYSRSMSSEEILSLPKSLVRARDEIRKDVSWQLRNVR